MAAPMENPVKAHAVAVDVRSADDQIIEADHVRANRLLRRLATAPTVTAVFRQHDGTSQFMVRADHAALVVDQLAGTVEVEDDRGGTIGAAPGCGGQPRFDSPPFPREVEIDDFNARRSGLDRLRQATVQRQVSNAGIERPQ